MEAAEALCTVSLRDGDGSRTSEPALPSSRGVIRGRVSSPHGTTIGGDASRGTRRCRRRRVAALRRRSTRALATVSVRSRVAAHTPGALRGSLPRARVGSVRRGVDSSRGWCAPSPRDLRRRRPGRRVRRRHGVSPRRVRKRRARRSDGRGTRIRRREETPRRSDFSARFLGPGEAVGEDAALRGGRFDRGTHRTFDRGTRSAPRRLFASSSDDATHRCRAVRDTQVLWIPASGLDALAAAAPRAFVSLAWRAGARSNAVGSNVNADHLGLGGVESRGVTSRLESTVAGEPRARPFTYHPTTALLETRLARPPAANGGGGSRLGGCGVGAGRHFAGAVLAALRETSRGARGDARRGCAEVATGGALVRWLARRAAHWVGATRGDERRRPPQGGSVHRRRGARVSRSRRCTSPWRASSGQPPGRRRRVTCSSPRLLGIANGRRCWRNARSCCCTPPPNSRRLRTRPCMEAFWVIATDQVARARARTRPGARRALGAFAQASRRALMAQSKKAARRTR